MLPDAQAPAQTTSPLSTFKVSAHLRRVTYSYMRPSQAIFGLSVLALLGTANAQTAKVSSATNKVVSGLAIEVSGAIKARMTSCPSKLKLSASAICLYAQNTPANLRPLIRNALGGRALGEWKQLKTASSLLVSGSNNGPLNAYVFMTPLSDKETLLVLDQASAKTASANTSAAAPAGVTKGQPYVLASDLVGVVKVAALGGGKYSLVANGQTMTVVVGQTSAQLGSGQIQLPLAPATDGKKLIFPLSGLRSLGCTLTPTGEVVTVACGKASLGLRPIIF